MTFFTYKIDNIREKIVTMQLSTAVSHRGWIVVSLRVKFGSFISIGEEEFSKLIKSYKSTTCMLDPIPTKLLKEMLPEVIDPLLLNILN